MMGNYTFFNSFTGLHLHFVFVGMLTVGAILFVFWAVKYLDKKRLANYSGLLILAGILGLLLTAGWGLSAWTQMFRCTGL